MNLFLLISWLATWYSLDGNYTSSGEIFDSNKMTCASNHYKVGTLLEVTNIANGKSVVVKVNDTGLFKGKKLDLSKGAFSKIANLKQGVIKIKVEKFNNKMNDLYYESTYEIQQLNNDELELYLKTI